MTADIALEPRGGAAVRQDPEELRAAAELDVRAAAGRVRLAWRQMPVLAGLRRQVRADRPLLGVSVAAALHVSAESAHLVVTLREAGAKVLLFASNPDTVSGAAFAELRRRSIKVWPGESGPEETAARLSEFGPQLLLDNAMLLAACAPVEALSAGLVGATVHSTNAERAVRALLGTGSHQGLPVVSIAGSALKRTIETPAGTGQSTVHALVRATGLQLSGKRAVVVGYGTAGGGIARYLSSMRARVTVVDTSAVACLRALNDGHDVEALDNALGGADVVIVATGTRAVLTDRHFDLLRDGVVLGNIGHHSDAINVRALRDGADKRTDLGGGVEELVSGGRSVVLLGRGSQLNHVCGDGNASEVMDLTLSLHLMCLLRLAEAGQTFGPGLSSVPDSLVEAVARAKLRQLGHVV